jgi:hypothetical protein
MLRSSRLIFTHFPIRIRWTVPDERTLSRTHPIQEASVENRLFTGMRIAYVAVAWVYVAAILFQVLLIGLNLFAGEPTRETHVGFGHMIGIAPLLLLIIAFVGRLPRWTKTLAGLQFGVFIVHSEVFAGIRSSAPVIASFHPVLALLLFTLAVYVAYRSLALVGTPQRVLVDSR